MEEVVIVAGARTAIGRFGGSLVEIPAHKLGALAIKEALRRAGVSPQDVDEVIMGCTVAVMEESNLARQSALAAGLPEETPAYTVNRLCGSGLEAINTASRAIQAGDAEIVVAGGAESMSLMPYVVRRARWGLRMGNAVLEDTMAGGVLQCPTNHYHMGVTAENLAKRYGITREGQDEFAVMSQKRAGAAIKEGRFRDEIVPYPVPQPRGEPKLFDADEHPRPDTTLEALSRLRPAFQEGGTVTAGNSSGINDAGAAVVVMSRRRAEAMGIKPILTVQSRATAGVEPSIMGIGPAPATRRVLDKAGLALDDIDLVELNEAFAAQSLAVGKELGLDWEKVNVNGGATALGHPVGATGTILTIKLMNEMLRRDSRYGLVTLCIGGGQGIATIFERAW